MPEYITLHDITTEMQAILDRLMMGEEVTDAEMDALMELEDDLATKVSGYVKAIRSMEATSQAYKDEEDRLKARRKASANAASRLKERLQHHLDMIRVDTVETDVAKVRVQQHHSPGLKLRVADDQLPERFARVKTYADKTALKEALEEGDAEAAEYAELTAPSRYVRIY
jgi:hypothetical protein